MENVYKLHGMPTTIVSDRDNIFLSQFWKELFKQQGVNLQYSTAYHPQSDGQTEVVNKCIEGYLRCMTGTIPAQWGRWLSSLNGGTIRTTTPLLKRHPTRSYMEWRLQFTFPIHLRTHQWRLWTSIWLKGKTCSSSSGATSCGPKTKWHIKQTRKGAKECSLKVT